MSRTSLLVIPWRSKVEELKNLSDSTVVNPLVDLEILRYARDDRVGMPSVVIPRERSDRGNLSLYAEEIVTSGIALFAFDVVMHLQTLSI
jgi:hypothetical protein